MKFYSCSTHQVTSTVHMTTPTLLGKVKQWMECFFPLGSCDQRCQSSLKMASTCLPRVGWDILREMAHKINCLWRCQNLETPMKMRTMGTHVLVNWGPPASSAAQPSRKCYMPKSWPVYIEPILWKWKKQQKKTGTRTIGTHSYCCHGSCSDQGLKYKGVTLPICAVIKL